jgi:3-oxoacyl-[acyl-carrier-protein] synthase II
MSARAGSRKVVVTGVGAVTPIGSGAKEFWAGLAAGKSGVRRIARFDPTQFTTQIAAEMPGFPPAACEAEGEGRLKRSSRLGLEAAAEAIADSGVDFARTDPSRAGVVMGVGGELASLIDRDALVAGTVGEHGRGVSDFSILAHQISRRWGLEGPSFVTATACSSGNQALGQARELIRMKAADVMVAGGADAPIYPVVVAGFCALRIMSKRNDDPERASRPFDKLRDGFVLGEGAGVLVLESLEHARARGARVYCELAGYGATSDAFHMTMPDPSRTQMVRSMADALADARLEPGNVDYVSAHGTSTPAGDRGETLALKTLFGPAARRIPVSSVKSMLGHTMGAAGAIEAVACVLSMANGAVPPTINQEVPDPELDLDYVPNEAREHEVRSALSNSFGFGGNNSTLLFLKAENLVE